MSLRFVEGCQNPADLTTRAVSSYTVNKSNFLVGPSMEVLLGEHDEVVVGGSEESLQVCASTFEFEEPIIDLDRYSSFEKCSRVVNYVYGFINRLKSRLYSRDPTKYEKFQVLSNSYVLSKEYIIRKTQEGVFPEVFKLFRGECSKCLPIVTQLNLILDRKNILRVKSKFRRKEEELPILLPRDCQIAKSIMNEFS